MKKIATLLCTFLLAACSTQKYNTFPDELTVAETKGIAIGTITFEGDVPVNDIYRFFYTPISSDKKFIRQNDGKVLIEGRKDNKSAFNGDFNDKKTYLIVIEAEPANYAFTQYNYLDHIGSNGMVSTSKEFSIPFEIKQNAISYFGELAYVDKAQPGSPRIYVSDKYERDIKEFKNKYPDVNWDSTVNNVAKSGNDGGGIISFM